MNEQEPARTGEQPLESWKEIAAYLQRDATTVRRWEKKEGLPVHRHTHQRGTSVYAYPSEIDAWRSGRKVVPEPAPVRAFWRWPAFAATMLLCLVMVGNGVRPVSAQGHGGPSIRQVWTPQFVGRNATPSPDGRYLVYTDWNSGELAVRDLTTGSNRRLTDESEGFREGQAEHAVVSPDGHLAAYAWIDYKTGATELRTLPIVGGEAARPRIVHQSKETKYLWPFGWTPDGKQLLVLRDLPDQTHQIAMMSAEDGSFRVLKSFGWQGPDKLSLSPDARYIAYDAPASDDVAVFDIYVMAVDGSQAGKVVDSPSLDWSPQWSPDGSQILFLSDRTGGVSLWSVRIEGGKAKSPATLVKTDVGPIVLLGMTRSGELYYNSGVLERRNTYVADLDSDHVAHNPPAVAAGRFINSNRGAAWSPDGELLAYYAFRVPSDNFPGSAELFVRTLKTGAEREIAMPQLRVPAYAFATPVRWFPDGRSVLVASYDQKAGAGFYRVDIATGKSQLLHHTRTTEPGPSLPDLSPDGKVIFYVERDPAAPRNRKVMRFDLDSQRETELKQPSQGQELTAIAVSPDGAQLAYGLSDVSTQSTVLEVMPSAGGAPHQVFRATGWRNGARYNLGWSRDQRYLIFVRPEGNASKPQVLWRVPLQGGDPEKMGISMPDIFFPQMSPDGRRIAFTSREDAAEEVWALENFLPKGK